MIRLSEDQIVQSDSQIRQARAGFQPLLSLQASLSQQAESTNALANSLSSTRQSATSINLSQSLFHGFKDSATVSQRKNLKSGSEWAKKQTIQQLFQNVSQAYFSILIFQSDMAIYQDQIKSTMQRKSELSLAKKSGRARESDILTAESSIASLEATISRTEGWVVTFQETFTFLTGLPNHTKLIDNIQLPQNFKTVDQWLQKTIQRPDVQQMKSELFASSDGIRVAQSGYYPTLGLSANYYLSRPRGIFQGVDWDTSLTLSIPLFSGGFTKAQVSEAVIINHSKELMLKQTEEMAEQSIRSVFATLESDSDQLKKLSRASDLSRRSYDLIRKDNRLGIASNTDVLTALQVWQESKRNLERARITMVFDYVKLLLETSEDIEIKASDSNE